MTHNCTSSTVYVPRSISKGGGAVSGERYFGGRPDVASGSEEMSAGGAAAALVEEVAEVNTTSSSAAPKRLHAPEASRSEYANGIRRAGLR